MNAVIVTDKRTGAQRGFICFVEEAEAVASSYLAGDARISISAIDLVTLEPFRQIIAADTVSDLKLYEPTAQELTKARDKARQRERQETPPPFMRAPKRAASTVSTVAAQVAEAGIPGIASVRHPALFGQAGAKRKEKAH